MTSKICAATIQEGKRKGHPCAFPAEEDGYCGRHKRNKLLVIQKKTPARAVSHVI
jgi:hypothetical protein